MSIIKTRAAKKQLLFLVLFLQSAALCAAATEEPKGAQSLKQLCERVLIDRPEQVLQDLDRLHADRASVANGLHITIPAQSIKEVLGQRPIRIYDAPNCWGGADFSPNGALIAAGCSNKLYVWREGISKPKNLEVIDIYHSIHSVKFLNDTQMLVATIAGIHIWDIEQRYIQEIPIQQSSKIIYNHATQKIYLSQPEGLSVVESIDATDQRPIVGFYGISAVNSNGNMIVTFDEDGYMNMINMDTRRVERIFLYDNNSHTAFNGEGNHLAITYANTIHIRDVQTGGRLKELSFPKVPWCGAFSSIVYAGDKLVGRFGRGWIYIFNAQTGRLERFWKDGESQLPVVCSPDGSKIAAVFSESKTAAASDESRIHVYDLSCETEDNLNALNIDEQRLMLRASTYWQNDMPYYVDWSNPIVQQVLKRFPNLCNDRYFVFAEPLPLTPVISSDAPSSSSSSSATSSSSFDASASITKPSSRRASRKCTIS